MRLRGAIAGFAVAALIFASPASAATKPPSAPALMAGVSRLSTELALLGQGSNSLGLPRNRPISELSFKNHDGYEVTVVAFGQTVSLSVARDHGNGSGKKTLTTTYLAHGRVTRSSIRASFADRGSISLRFRPSTQAVRANGLAGCRTSGGNLIARLGVFVGELRFRGEGGYTSAEVHRVRGSSVDLAALLACLIGATQRGQHLALPAPKLPWGIRLSEVGAGVWKTGPSTPSVPTHPSTGPKPTTLLAGLKTPLTRTAFAAQTKGQGRAHFLAVSEASEGSIGVVRIAMAPAPPSAFSFDDTLASASVTPPSPFTGTGAYRQGPGTAKSWTGPLALSFLGAPHVPLTGPPFSIRLARGF
jgi:hypothetical protein